MRINILILLLIVFSSCTEQIRSGEQDRAAGGLDSIHSKGTVSMKRSSPGVIWSSENVRIFGDTTKERSKIERISVKFLPYISFQDFPVNTNEVKGRKEALDWLSNKRAKRFKTRIETSYEKDLDHFAGHYVVAYWGCGSPCQSGVIIDRNTGKIYDLPAAAFGYDFKRNSRMLIVNKPDSSGFYDDCVYCMPEIHIWDEDRKEFIERRPELR